jgi:citrate lyase subunit beta/citryl-CoA lyase
MEKAFASGAGALILDLEDSVASAAKADARHAVRAFLERTDRTGPQLWVRINPLATDFSAADVESLLPAAPDGFIVPKATPGDVARLDVWLAPLEAAAGLSSGHVRLLPIATETAAAVFQLPDYAQRRNRLAGLTWGAEDLSAALGALSARDEAGRYTPVYDLARSMTLLAAAAAEVPAVETVYPDFRDLAGLAGYVARARRDGFISMMAIHPAQVSIIDEGFAPSSAELEHAHAVIAAFEAEPGAGVVSLGGKMLDAPHLAQARRLLQRR